MSKNEGGIVFTTPAGTNAEKTLGATAGNAVGTILTVPAGQRYLILYGRIRITTDVTVANRYPNIYVDDGSGNIRWKSNGGIAIVASTSLAGTSFQSGFHDVSSAKAETGGNVGIPYPLILEAGEILYASVTNGVAGDSYTARFYVLAMGVKT